jgi:parallel beta-helix repeat protein
MRHLTFVLLPLLLVLPSAAHAEANACQPVGNIIIVPGSYCLTADFFQQGGPDSIAIDIGANDVTLDCNGHRVVGPVIAPELVQDDVSTGIYIGSSRRVTVRNCRVVGFNTGIFVGRATSDGARSRDVTIEDNTLIGNGWGMFLNVEGNNRVRRNVVTDAQVRGIEAYAAGGQSTIRDNVFLRVGDTTWNQGRGGYFSSELGGWMIVQDNVFSEVVAPAGTAGAPAVRLGPAGGVGVLFSHNRILAPANPAEKGADTLGIDNIGGHACEGNLIVGYGTAPIPGCTVPTNEQR